MATGPVVVTLPSAAPSVLERCTALVAALPATLVAEAGPLARRPVAEPRAAAWGDDPPVLLECGVPDAPLVGDVFSYTPPGGTTLSFVQDDVGAARTFTTGELSVDVRLTQPDRHPGAYLVDLVPLLTTRLS